MQVSFAINCRAASWCENGSPVSTDHETFVQLFDQGMLFPTFLLVLLHRVLASGSAPEGEAAQNPILRLYDLDKESRDYSHSRALRYDSPTVQSRVYREARSRTLNNLDENRKALVIFDAEGLPSVKNVLYKNGMFMFNRESDSPTSRSYYVSWYMKYRVHGEGTELVYFLHAAPPITPCLIWMCLKYSVPHDPCGIPCLYPPMGAFHMTNGHGILRFDANGRRIRTLGGELGDPNWPVRLTVMTVVLEAIQIAEEKFADWLSHAEGFESQILGCKYDNDREIISYNPRFRQFDLLDNSMPLLYSREIKPGVKRDACPICPKYWQSPDCYLLAVRPADTILKQGQTCFWVMEIKFRKPFTVSRLTSAWFYENASRLTPTSLYDMTENYLPCP